MNAIGRFGGWSKRVFWSRRAASTTLVVLASLLTLVSAFSIYVREVVLDTETWADTTGEMLENDTIRGVLAQYLVDELYANVNVAEQVDDRLPDGLQGLAGLVAGSLRQVAVNAADSFLDAPRVQELWRQANIVAHTQLVAAIEDDQEEPVVLSLGPMIEELALRIGLPQAVATILAGRAGEVVILDEEQVDTAREATDVLTKAAFWLLIASVLLAVAAVYVGRGRRREVVRALALGLLVVGILLIVARRFIGTAVVEAIVESRDVEPAGIAAWLIATKSLQETTAVAVTVGALGVLWAWLCGPTRWATGLRRRAAPMFRDHLIVPYGAFGLIALVLIAWGPLGDSSSLAALGIVIVLLVLGIETLRRKVVAEAPPAAEHTAEP